MLAIGFYAFAIPRVQPVDEIRVGVLPDQDPDRLRQRYAPLLEHLANRSGLPTRLVLPVDYEDLVDRFGRGEIDLAYFGGLTFVQAQATHGARPLVMRAIDTRFTSWFLVRQELAHLELGDFAGRRLAFGSRLSTSGHLMPRHFLQSRWQIDPDSFFGRIEYSGAHDKTALMVRAGEVDLGVANSAIVRKMLDDGRLGQNDLHVLWQTPPYPDYVWAVPARLDNDLETKLRNAFLELDITRAEQAAILRNLGAEAYLPADPRDFTDLNQIATRLGMLAQAQ